MTTLISSIGANRTNNKVLKNTYMLLGISLLPTILGAWLGVETGIGKIFSGFLGFILFMVLSFGFIFAIEKNKNNVAGLPLLLGFTFFMGVSLSNMIGSILGTHKDGAELIITAFSSTAIVFFAMSFLAGVIKKDLSSWGSWLFAGMIAIIGAVVINIFLQSSILMLVISGLSAIVFSLYLLYDLKKIIDGGETNYIIATLSIYISLINVFQSLLSLFSRVGD